MTGNAGIVVTMNEESTNHDNPWMMPGCWKSFLPSLGPAVIEVEPVKKVRFQLDDNKHHYDDIEVEEDADVDYRDLFISRNEIHSTELEMELTARYFRNLYQLENRMDLEQWKQIQAIKPDEVTSIGLEWLIWGDNKYERRQDMVDAIMWHSGNSLAYRCQQISRVAKKEARQRAERVVQELSKESSESAAYICCSNNNNNNNYNNETKPQPQWKKDFTALFKKRMPIVAKAATTTVPTEIFVPVSLHTTPAA